MMQRGKAVDTSRARVLAGAWVQLSVEHVDGSSLRVLRAGIGLVASVAFGRMLAYGWIDRLWVDPEVHLRWSGLAPPVLPGPWLHALVWLLLLASLLVAAGRIVRPACAVASVGLLYLELLEQAAWLNHHWALVLVLALLAVVGGTERRVPRWQVHLLRAQVGAIYLGAAVAKLNADWLLRGEPLGTWLGARAEMPVLGVLLAMPAVSLVLSWAGLLFDATIVGALWWGPTRRLAAVAVVTFHTITAALFPAIGVFPVLMVVLISVWLPPAWPARVLDRRATGDRRLVRDDRPIVEGWRWAPALVGAFAVVQLLVPLRHLAIPGDVRWTEEGGRFAWRVMAEEKVGAATFTVTDAATGLHRRVDLDDVLAPWQAHVAATRPDALLQVAHLLVDRARGDGAVTPRVTVDAWVSWNGRPRARLVDPTADLSAQRRGRTAMPWLLAPPR
jgi:vitamin K-dependent gamma-carboxylase